MPGAVPTDSPAPSVLPVTTRHGIARAHVHAVADPLGVLVLGHGAGGGIDAVDLVAVTAAAGAAGWGVVLVEQPYRVAARRATPRPAVLDEAWCDVVGALREAGTAGLSDGVRLVTGGRSAGSRVACRTALTTDAVAVVALAFPTQPPGRPDAPSRLPELDGAGVPVLVVQGASDPYGVPPGGPDRAVVVLAGDHGLKKDVPGVIRAVVDWLAALPR